MQKNYCAQCGTVLALQAKFCGACGAPVEVSSTTTDSALPTSIPTFKYKDDQPHSHIIAHKAPKGELPTIEFRDLHPTAVWLFFIAYLGRTFILVPLFIMVAFMEPLLTIVLATGYIVALYASAQLTFKNFKFEVTEIAFRKEHGIFHKQTISIPFEQIQNINVRRSIIDQMLGLAHVELETAGDSGVRGKQPVAGLRSASEGYIPGITYQEARDLKELLITRMRQSK